jgi:hypothetical protein
LRLRRGISLARRAAGSWGAGISRPTSIKLRDVQTPIIKEKDGSYAIAWSALGVYSVGKTLTEARHDLGP